MAYCTLQQARRQLETNMTADNQILADLLRDASQSLDDETGYWFEERYETHGFDGRTGYLNPLLNLQDYPLISVDSFLNGDGTAIAGANFTLLPIGRYPKTQVRLNTGNWFVPPNTWPYLLHENFAIDALQITGRWSLNRLGPNAWKDTGLTVSGSHSAAVLTLTMSAQGASIIDVGSTLKIAIASGAIEYLYVTGPVGASSASNNVPDFATNTPTVERGVNGSMALALAGGEKIYVYQIERTIAWACAEVVAAAYKSRDNAAGSAFNPGGFGTITIADLPDKVLEKLTYPYWSYQRGRPH